MATNIESTLHISDLILQASPVVQLVMLILLLASIFSWYLIAKLHMSYKKHAKMMNISKKCSGLVLNSIRFTTTHNSIQNVQALKISFIKD